MSIWSPENIGGGEGAGGAARGAAFIAAWIEDAIWGADSGGTFGDGG